MNKIITITLNPSLDVTIVTKHLHIGYYNQVAETKHLDASGRGVNVTRALAQLNIATHALISLGDDAISHAYQGLIAKESFPTTIIQHAGHTRSDTIILDNRFELQTETHLIDENSVCTLGDIQDLSEALQELIESGDIVVCAGKLPPQTPDTIYADLMAIAHKHGANGVVVASGNVLNYALATAPEMVVLRQLEAEALFNHPVRTLSDMLSAAKSLQDYGSHAVLMVTNDYKTVILVERDTILAAEISGIVLKGTESGVIDAMLATYLAALLKQQPYKRALTLAAAAMACAIEEIGNTFAPITQIREQTQRVYIKPIVMAASSVTS